jgi:multiple sugar transport system permease protein
MAERTFASRPEQAAGGLLSRGGRERLRWGLLMLLPFVWMISASLKTELTVFQWPIQWIPTPAHWANYATVWQGPPPFLLYVRNSVIVAVARVALDLLTSSLAAYGFARLQFRGRDLLFLIYLSTLLVPFQMLLVPRFILFHYLHIYDTLLALILPGAFTVFGTFLLRQFFLSIPAELTDAARMDGANDFGIYWRIIVPLARPALASLAILAFVWSWNDYESPLVMITSAANYTIPLGLTNYIDVNGGFSATLIMAGSVLATIPIIVVFIALQRQFLEAITRSGLKG